MQRAPSLPTWAAALRLRRFSRPEAATFALFSAALVLAAARIFYASLKLQIFYSAVRPDPYLSVHDWSAPLDDVFIHFDFARSIARGHPFEWSRGNGYSSGGTSLLYPFALAPGFALGFRRDRIMEFSAIVAATSLFATLLASRRLFRGLPTWTTYIAPPLLLSVGALDWSFFSGMEVAFFLATWALAFIAWDDLMQTDAAPDGVKAVRLRAVLLGLANAAVVATRPEAIVVVAVFAAFAGHRIRELAGYRSGLVVLALAGAPSVFLLAAQAIVNRVMTGDFSAAGALVKLELYDPHLSRQDVFDAWVFHVRYQVGRVTGYHLADGLLWGSLFWPLAGLPLAFRRTRRVGAVLWLQAILWVCIVALNGQVRWQNERYTMPALAWMLLSASLGIGQVLSHGYEASRRGRFLRYAAPALTIVLVGVLGIQQIPKMRDQIWFFGRASRNIRDQHLKAARKIRHELPGAHRVLVGDAGAIPYETDLPALDIIGLGGYPGLPFARASRWGIGAALELIERIPRRDRPDVMAIYPGWWGELPLWFGEAIDGVTVSGNVICGGLTKMIYGAHFEALDRSAFPAFPLSPVERLVDEVDFADVISERDHGYGISGALGYVDMKLLPHPTHAADDLWDAGRVVPPGAAVHFSLAGFDGARHARLVVRVAPPEPSSLSLSVGGKKVVTRAIHPSDEWQEVSLELPDGARSGSIATLSVDRNELVLYHLFEVESP